MDNDFTPGAETLIISDWSTPRFAINSLGNIGIGTTNPAVKLDVRGTIVTSDVNNSVPAATVLGAARGSYGIVGFNAIPQPTANTYNYNNADYASWIQFVSGGFNFYTAPGGPEVTPLWDHLKWSYNKMVM